MKKLVAVLVIVLSANVSNAQAFEKGGNYVNIGLGLEPFSFGPLVVGYERGITDLLGIGRIGVGGTIGHQFYHPNSNTIQNRTSIIGKCAYHFDFKIDKMDVYAGVGIGFQYRSEEKWKSNDVAFGLKAGVYPVMAAFGGIRYYFTESFGVYAEAGYGLGYLNGGLVFKF